ncbi:MAG: hypothetical protein WBW41_18260 [Verrucomicrobiia bacterium]
MNIIAAIAYHAGAQKALASCSRPSMDGTWHLFCHRLDLPKDASFRCARRLRVLPPAAALTAFYGTRQKSWALPFCVYSGESGGKGFADLAEILPRFANLICQHGWTASEPNFVLLKRPQPL